MAIFDDNFLARQNKRILDFPMIEGKELAVLLQEKMGTENLHSNLSLFSWLINDKDIGIVEEVYGAKWNKKGFYIQKLAVVPADKRYCTLSKNCWYECGGIYSGFHSYGYDGKSARYYSYMSEYEFSVIDMTKAGRQELFNLERILELDSSLKYCAYKSGNGIYAIDYISLYKEFPICEMLMKLNIKRMWTEKALKFITENKDFQKWLFKNAAKVSEMAFQTARNAFKKNPCGDPADYNSSLKFRIKCGKEASFDNQIVYHKALKFATQEKISQYIKGKKINKQSYGDYLTACDWLHLDFADTKVLFPIDFAAMHDEYTSQYALYKEEAEKEKLEREYKSISRKMLKTAKKFSFLETFKDDCYSVIIARTKLDLINEGEKLHHCVGKMDYDIRQSDGRSVICFIRKNSELEKPFVTAEIKIGEKLSVSQCYGDRDKVIHDVDNFVNKWMKISNRQYKKICQGA